jgi:hypothetical protein
LAKLAWDQQETLPGKPVAGTAQISGKTGLFQGEENDKRDAESCAGIRANVSGDPAVIAPKPLRPVILRPGLLTSLPFSDFVQSLLPSMKLHYKYAIRLLGKYTCVKNGENTQAVPMVALECITEILPDVPCPTEKAGLSPAFFLSHLWPG